MKQELHNRFRKFDAVIGNDESIVKRLLLESELIRAFKDIPFPVLRDERIAYLQSLSQSSEIIE